jgi:hypothetical protein
LQSNTSMLIYGDKVVYVDYNKEEAIMITQPDIAQFHRRIFKELFDRLPT